MGSPHRPGAWSLEVDHERRCSMAELLVANGADTHAVDGLGANAVMLAAGG